MTVQHYQQLALLLGTLTDVALSISVLIEAVKQIGLYHIGQIRKLTARTPNAPSQAPVERVKMAWLGVRKLIPSVRSVLRTNFRIRP
jgi:hypothetical protein